LSNRSTRDPFMLVIGIASLLVGVLAYLYANYFTALLGLSMGALFVIGSTILVKPPTKASRDLTTQGGHLPSENKGENYILMSTFTPHQMSRWTLVFGTLTGASALVFVVGSFAGLTALLVVGGVMMGIFGGVLIMPYRGRQLRNQRNWT
jgi:uncharacterized membrane protein HdeD (DUF308 family)